MHPILPAKASSATRSLVLPSAVAQVIRTNQANSVCLAVAAVAGSASTIRFGDSTVAPATIADIDLAAGVNVFRVDGDITHFTLFGAAASAVTFWTYNA